MPLSLLGSRTRPTTESVLKQTGRSGTCQEILTGILGSVTMNYFCCLGDFHDLAFFFQCTCILKVRLKTIKSFFFPLSDTESPYVPQAGDASASASSVLGLLGGTT